MAQISDQFASFFSLDFPVLVGTHRLNSGQVLPLGNMRINAITELRRLAGVKSLGDADSPTLLDVEICSQATTAAAGAGAGAAAGSAEKPNFGIKCKIFELDPCQVREKTSKSRRQLSCPWVRLIMNSVVLTSPSRTGKSGNQPVIASGLYIKTEIMGVLWTPLRSPSDFPVLARAMNFAKPC